MIFATGETQFIYYEAVLVRQSRTNISSLISPCTLGIWPEFSFFSGLIKFQTILTILVEAWKMLSFSSRVKSLTFPLLGTQAWHHVIADLQPSYETEKCC